MPGSCRVRRVARERADRDFITGVSICETTDEAVWFPITASSAGRAGKLGRSVGGVHDQLADRPGIARMTLGDGQPKGFERGRGELEHDRVEVAAEERHAAPADRALAPTVGSQGLPRLAIRGAFEPDAARPVGAL